MTTFDEAYWKSCKVTRDRLADDWDSIRRRVKALLQDGGPATAEAQVLQDLRAKLSAAALGRPGQHREAIADEILRASRAPEPGFQDRAALLKLLEHFYLVRQKGGQAVWAYAGTQDYTLWVYDKLNGLGQPEVRKRLLHFTEVINRDHRNMLADALQHAGRLAHKVAVKLAAPDELTRGLVRKWFLTGPAPERSAAEKDAAEKDVAGMVRTLKAGFHKIARACHAPLVIFSDNSADRDGSWVAEVAPSSDSMVVIYVTKWLFRPDSDYGTGQGGLREQAALAIIHELSHRELDTGDGKYKPGYVGDVTPPESAVELATARRTATYWEYFARELFKAERGPDKR
jgi:hypothetical protein